MNMGLNAFFIYHMGWGVFSVALATSLTAWVHLFGLVMVMKKEGLFIWPTAFGYFLRDMFFGSSLACGFLWIYKNIFII